MNVGLYIGHIQVIHRPYVGHTQAVHKLCAAYSTDHSKDIENGGGGLRVLKNITNLGIFKWIQISTYAYLLNVEVNNSEN